jgi:hypothetical protein
MSVQRVTPTGQTIRAVTDGEAPDAIDPAWAPPVASPTPALPVKSGSEYRDRGVAITAIRAALRERSGKTWSVTGGRGTGYGFIDIQSPPARRADEWTMTDVERSELAALLSLPRDMVGRDGVTVMASGDYREEYVARAQGRAPEMYGRAYWD